ncbi:MAG TPA: deoxyribose-phosphate aldolase [Bacteroidales bacterium]|nr:deoxyribose-phosphate aldolase [Bacteroidales bacterium]
MIKLEEKYDLTINHDEIIEKTEKIVARSVQVKDREIMKHIFSLIDLTTLDVTDTDEKVMNYVRKVNQLPAKFPELPNVAAICVYPCFVPLIKSNLDAKNVKIASVAGSFPSSQTFTDIKLKEVERVLEEGADEVDIVMPVGKFLEKKFDYVFEEIQKIKKVTGKSHLKVILETGSLEDLNMVRHASLLCLEAGADFIKTSTGKTATGATPEAVYVMCEAIKDFARVTGKTPGIKPAGGISDASTAISYYLIVNQILGNDWVKPQRFRIGASRLANNLLGEKYF